MPFRVSISELMIARENLTGRYIASTPSCVIERVRRSFRSQNLGRRRIRTHTCGLSADLPIMRISTLHISLSHAVELLQFKHNKWSPPPPISFNVPTPIDHDNSFKATVSEPHNVIVKHATLNTRSREV